MKTRFAFALVIALLCTGVLLARADVQSLSFTLKQTGIADQKPVTAPPAEAQAPPAVPASAALPADAGDCRIRNAGQVILRAEPKLESAVVATLDANDKITVLEKSGGWKKVRCAKGTGYLRVYYLADPKDADTGTSTTTATAPTASGSTATVSANTASTTGSTLGTGAKKNLHPGAVHMRAAKSVDAACPGIIPPGGDVVVLAVEGDWALVQSGGAQGYVRSAYVGDKPPASHNGRIVDTPATRPTTPTPATPAKPATPPAATSGDGGSGRFGGKMVDSSRVTSEFGWRVIFGKRSHHNGIDIGVPTGTPAKAVGDGKVTKIGFDSGGGRYIDVKYDNGYSSRYYHLKDTTVKQGDRVSQGQVICHTDNTGAYTTGAHLHAEFKNAKGQFVNPRSIPGLKI